MLVNYSFNRLSRPHNVGRREICSEHFSSSSRMMKLLARIPFQDAGVSQRRLRQTRRKVSWGFAISSIGVEASRKTQRYQTTSSVDDSSDSSPLNQPIFAVAPNKLKITNKHSLKGVLDEIRFLISSLSNRESGAGEETKSLFTPTADESATTRIVFLGFVVQFNLLEMSSQNKYLVDEINRRLLVTPMTSFPTNWLRRLLILVGRVLRVIHNSGRRQ